MVSKNNPNQMRRRVVLGGAAVGAVLFLNGCGGGGGAGTLTIDNQLCSGVCPRTFSVKPQPTAEKLKGNIAEVSIIVDNKGATAVNGMKLSFTGTAGLAAAGAKASFYADSTPAATFAMNGDTPVITVATVAANSTVSLHFMMQVTDLAKATAVTVADTVTVVLGGTVAGSGTAIAASATTTVTPVVATGATAPSATTTVYAVTADLFRDATTGYYDLIVKVPDLATLRSIGLLRTLADSESIVGIYVNSDTTGWDVNDNNTVAVRSTYGAPILNGVATIKRLPADLVGIILSKKGYAVAGGWQLSVHVMTTSGYVVPIYVKPRGVGGDYVPPGGLTVTK